MGTAGGGFLIVSRQAGMENWDGGTGVPTTYRQSKGNTRQLSLWLLPPSFT